MPPILFLLLAADLTIKVTPEPLAVTKARLGDVQGMGAWRMIACSEADDPVTVSALRLEMAIADLSLIDPESAAEILRTTRDRRVRVRIGQVLGVAAVAATAIAAGGYVQLTGKEAALLGLGIKLASDVRGRVDRSVIVLDPSRLLSGTMTLQPGECTSKVLFAALMPRQRVRAYTYTLTIKPPRRLPVAGVTSIPS